MQCKICVFNLYSISYKTYRIIPSGLGMDNERECLNWDYGGLMGLWGELNLFGVE